MRTLILLYFAWRHNSSCKFRRNMDGDGTANRNRITLNWNLQTRTVQRVSQVACLSRRYHVQSSPALKDLYSVNLKAYSIIYPTYLIMDRQSVYSLSVLPPDFDAAQNSRTQIQSQLREFILEFRLDNAFIYRYNQ